MPGTVGAVSERSQYLALMGICLLGTQFLEFRFDARIWRRPVAVIRALILPFVAFNIVNQIAVLRELWWYSSRFTTGLTLPTGYPIEELVFFVAIPICALLTFEAATGVYEGRVKSVTGKLMTPLTKQYAPPAAQRAVSLVSLVTALVLAAALGLLLLELWRHREWDVVARSERLVREQDWSIPEYPVLAAALVAGVLLLETAWWRTGIFRLRAYWSTMAICLGFMIPVNGWLTKLSAPIVLYAEDEFSGLRPIWDIPLEDFPFGIALLTLVLMNWVRVTRRGSVPEP
jgi:lycopene cyclase domain-containing protein